MPHLTVNITVWYEVLRFKNYRRFTKIEIKKEIPDTCQRFQLDYQHTTDASQNRASFCSMSCAGVDYTVYFPERLH